MADLKKSARKARKQLGNLEVPEFHFDDIEWNILRRREEEAASKGFLGGFLVGILVGAILALVFAPRRGDETREIVAATATDLKDKASGLVSQVRSDSELHMEPVEDGPAIEREFGDTGASERASS